MLDFINDKFFNEKFDLFQQAKFLEKYNSGIRHASSVDDIWYGEVKNCPRCEAVRITGCSACGCGTCYTCGYRWSCCYYETLITLGKTNFPSLTED